MINESGKMKPLLISLLLIVCFSLSFSSNSHKVPQTADISCCLAKSIQRGRVHWFKNKSKIIEAVIHPKDKNVKCFNSTISNISISSLDIYTCKVFVEIPSLTELEGNVTIIRGNATEEQRDTPTKDMEEPPPKPTSSIIVALAVVLPLMLITTICFCRLQKSKGITTEGIYDVPNFDSTGAGMDEHSTSSSRGSSQWCQVPLYDSLAYFEKAGNKESE